MASAFGHALTAYSLGKIYPKSINSWKFLALGVICSIIPDADIITFQFGIPYEHLFGHRGFFHSFLFAAILGLFATIIFYSKQAFGLKGIGLFTYFTLCTASHGLLDAMTSGGLGVAFFSPWDNTRHFLPWRPIKVSPIGLENFFSEWGWQVVKSEMVWIGLPCVLVLIIKGLLSRISKT